MHYHRSIQFFFWWWPSIPRVLVITMAGNTSADCSMNVRLLINKKDRRAVYAEAGKDFVDLLLTFLLLPTGAIIRILPKHGSMSSNSRQAGCNLYDY